MINSFGVSALEYFIAIYCQLLATFTICFYERGIEGEDVKFTIDLRPLDLSRKISAGTHTIIMPFDRNPAWDTINICKVINRLRDSLFISHVWVGCQENCRLK